MNSIRCWPRSSGIRATITSMGADCGGQTSGSIRTTSYIMSERIRSFCLFYAMTGDIPISEQTEPEPTQTKNTTMSPCEMKPGDKRKFVSDVGQRLVQDHGKKKYYKPDQIRKAAHDGGYQPDYICWAYCMFSSPSDFAAIHEAAGETCDYVAMKSEVLADLATDGSFLGIDIDLSDLFDWFDLS